MNRGTSVFILLLVLCSAVVLHAKIGMVCAGGTVYIRADGSVEGTDKIQRDGNVYTFTGDISASLVVERDGIVVDGAGHVLEGAGTGRGIFLEGRSNITIKNTAIREFASGIDLWNSSGNTISANAIANTSTGIYLVSRSDGNSICANNMANNQWGISLTGASNNSISANNMANNDVGISLNGASNNSVSANDMTGNNVYGISLSFVSDNSISANNIADNSYGIYLYSPSGSNSISANNIANNDVGISLNGISNNLICHNNFVGNAVQAQVIPPECVNVWDAGYPSGGNYWSDYSGVDLNSGPYQNEAGSDGIGDGNYTINADNNDRYPLMGPISTFNCGSWDSKQYYVDMASNSTISAFNFNAVQKLISFNVNGSAGTIGFCKITIDGLLLGGPYTVLVDATPVTQLVTSNGTHSSLYFTYAQTTHNVTITGTVAIPDAPTSLGLILIMAVTVSTLLYMKKKRLSR